MWQTCHRNGQPDKCRVVAERHGLHSVPPVCCPQCFAERRAGDAMQGKRSERRDGRRGDAAGGTEKGSEEGCRDRESDFQRDNEPLNDG